MIAVAILGSGGQGYAVPQAAVILPLRTSEPVTEARLFPKLERGPTTQPVGASGDGPARILLVEGHEPTRLTLVQLLKRRGFQVGAVATMSAALEITEEETFHWCSRISDFRMAMGSSGCVDCAQGTAFEEVR